MNVIFTKRIFVTLLLALFSASFSFASDDETAQVKKPTATLKGINFTGAATEERMNEYIKEVKDYDIFITVPDSLKSIDMREVQNFCTNISRNWDYPWLGHNELKIGLEANSSNAVFLFPNLLFAWPKNSLRASYCVGEELRYSNKDRSINIPDHVTTIINTDKERYAGADTIMIYNLDLEVPLFDTYNHCIGVYLRTYGHHALPLKIALTDEGLKNADQYINTLFDMVKIGSNPHPEYLKAEEETKTDRDLYE